MFKGVVLLKMLKKYDADGSNQSTLEIITRITNTVIISRVLWFKHF